MNRKTRGDVVLERWQHEQGQRTPNRPWSARVVVSAPHTPTDAKTFRGDTDAAVGPDRPFTIGDHPMDGPASDRTLRVAEANGFVTNPYLRSNSSSYGANAISRGGKRQCRSPRHGGRSDGPSSHGDITIQLPGEAQNHAARYYVEKEQCPPPDWNQAYVFKEPSAGPITRVGDKTYTVVRLIELPYIDFRKMNAGIRVLASKDHGKVLEKRLKMYVVEQRERAASERNALVQLAQAGGHANIVRIYESVWEPGYYHCSLVMEYCRIGTLSEFVETYTPTSKLIEEKYCWQVLFQLASALAMCHEGIRDVHRPSNKIANWNPIYHLDIKLGNIFLDAEQEPHIIHKHGLPRVVLRDFGCSVTQADFDTGRFDVDKMELGTPYCLPPEKWDWQMDEHVEGPSGAFTDVWQMGAVIQCMTRLTQHTLESFMTMMPCDIVYSNELNDIIRRCLSRTYRERPTAIEVALLAMKHAR